MKRPSVEPGEIGPLAFTSGTLNRPMRQCHFHQWRCGEVIECCSRWSIAWRPTREAFPIAQSRETNCRIGCRGPRCSGYRALGRQHVGSSGLCRPGDAGGRRARGSAVHARLRDGGDLRNARDAVIAVRRSDRIVASRCQAGADEAMAKPHDESATRHSVTARIIRALRSLARSPGRRPTAASLRASSPRTVTPRSCASLRSS